VGANVRHDGRFTGEVRAATFSRARQPASAVTLIVAVTSGFFTQLPDNARAAAPGLLD
jgi:hypothetical protein